MLESVEGYNDCLTEIDDFKMHSKDWFDSQNYQFTEVLGGEFLSSISRQHISSIGIFDCADYSFIEALSHCAISEQFEKDDMIVKIGDHANCMYFVMMGTVEVVGESDKVQYVICNLVH